MEDKEKPVKIEVTRWEIIDRPWGEEEELITEEVELEPSIAPLVIGLRRLDLETIESCEGHLNKKYLYYPWVRIGENSFYGEGVFTEDIFFIEIIVKKWNKLQKKKEKGILWEISWYSSKIMELRPINRKLPLPELQAAAKEFGIWLQNLPASEIKRLREVARKLRKLAEEEEYKREMEEEKWEEILRGDEFKKIVEEIANEKDPHRKMLLLRDLERKVKNIIKGRA
jgi:hypothetical protein